MKILLLHNRYRSTLPSGENQVVDNEIQMLRGAGVDVIVHQRDSDEIDGYGVAERIALTVRPIYSRSEAQTVRRLIDDVRPDIVHLHNPYPLLSPAVIRSAKSAEVPVVHSVHNFRFRCMNGLYLRDGKVCTECKTTAIPWPGVRHGCYRGSHAQSAIMGASLTVNRSTWNSVDRHFAVSPFVASELISSGVNEDRVRIKPNAVPDPGPATPLGTGYLYVGRLDHQKGIDLLLEAWGRSGAGETTTLTLAGDGPLAAEVAAQARRDPSIKHLGPVPHSEILELLRAAAVSVVPSVSFEASSLAAIESLGAGRPVIASNMGGLRDLVDNEVGWSIAPSVDSLSDALVESSSPGAAEQRALAARALYERRYTPTRVIGLLCDLYQEVIDGAIDDPRPR